MNEKKTPTALKKYFLLVVVLSGISGSIISVLQSGIMIQKNKNILKIYDSNISIFLDRVDNRIYFDTITEIDNGILIGAVGEEFETPSSQAGIYKSLDEGRTWTLIKRFKNLTYTPKNARCIYVSQNGTIFVGGSQVIYVSTDQGNTWYNASSETFPPSQANLWRIAETSNHTFFAGFHGRKAWIWRSDDYGHSWRNVTTEFGWVDDNIHDIKINMKNNWIYVTIGGNRRIDGTLNGRGLWRSKDFGKTWTQLIRAVDKEETIRLAIVLNETKTYLNTSEVGVFIGTEKASGADIYYFLDRGEDERLYRKDLIKVLDLDDSWHGVILWALNISDVFYFGVGCTGSSSGSLKGGIYAIVNGKTVTEIDSLSNVVQRKSYYFASSGWSLNKIYISHREGSMIIQSEKSHAIEKITHIPLMD